MRSPRPAWPYRLNTSSRQAIGLAAWFPFAPHNPQLDMSLLLPSTATVTGEVYPEASGPAWSTGMRFAGDNDYITYSSNSKFNVNAGGAFTLSCWTVMRITNDYQGFIGYGSNIAGVGGQEYGYGLRYRADTAKFDFVIGRASNFGFSVESTTSGTAYNLFHVAGVYSAGVAKIYVNGRQENEQSVTVATGSHTFQLGRYTQNAAYNPYCLDGWLMDTRVYSRALSHQEVLSIYDPATRYDLYWMPWSQPYTDIGGTQIAYSGRWRVY